MTDQTKQPNADGYYPVEKAFDIVYCLDKNGNVFALMDGEYIQLKPVNMTETYLRVRLPGRGTHHIHKLAARAYFGPNMCQLVRHLNDNPHDNSLTNIRWGTDQDNRQDLARNQNNPKHWTRLRDQEKNWRPRIRTQIVTADSFKKKAP